MQQKYIGSNYVLPQKMGNKKSNRQNQFFPQIAILFCILPIANREKIRYGKTKESKGENISGGKKMEEKEWAIWR